MGVCKDFSGDDARGIEDVLVGFVGDRIRCGVVERDGLGGDVLESKVSSSQSSQRLRRWPRDGLFRVWAGVAGFLKTSEGVSAAGSSGGGGRPPWPLSLDLVVVGFDGTSRSSLSDPSLLEVETVLKVGNGLVEFHDFVVLGGADDTSLLGANRGGGGGGGKGDEGGGSVSLLSSCADSTFFIALLCSTACSFALTFICPSEDSFAPATTGLGVAMFFCSSIFALRVSYSARCRCWVNSLAVWSNSSSTIIHSSSRRSNLSTPMSMYLKCLARYAWTRE